MTKRYKNTFRSKVLEEIQRLDGSVVLRTDLKDLGSPRQVSRALKALVEDGDLVKFGHGIYVKTEKTIYSDNPIMKISSTEACVETLERLGIRWQLGKAIQDYNDGKTQQVPAKFIVKLNDRFRGRLDISGRRIAFEGSINAR